MNYNLQECEMELICIVVNFGMGSKVLKSARQHGIHGGTLEIARGTANNKILDYLALSDVRKEILYMVADRKTAYHALDKIEEEFKLKKPNHGIAFTTSVTGTVGLRHDQCDHMEIERGENHKMYHIITTIVDKGMAEDVIEAARKAGSKGGTIMNGRGAGMHETSRLFSMDIEPEKEIVLILSEHDMTDQIVSAIRTDMHIDAPGKGIVYVQDVNRTYGITK